MNIQAAMKKAVEPGTLQQMTCLPMIGKLLRNELRNEIGNRIKGFFKLKKII